MEKDFKLVALDMDGTLLDDNSNFSKRTVLKLQELIRRDMHVVFATGRTYKSARNVMERMELSIPIIAHNGAKIMLPQAKELYNKKMPVEDARTVLKFMSRQKVQSVAFVNSVMHIEKPNKELIQFTREHGIDYKVIGDLAENINEDVNLIFSISPEPVKQNFDGVFKDLNVSITQSMPNAYEFMAKGCNKGSALSTLANHLGVNNKEILAVGNALNDLEMLAFAGKGIAMKNSDARLLELWDYVSEFTNNEDGVYEILTTQK